MEFKKPKNWLALVQTVKTLDDYIQLVGEMFIDNKFTEGRKYVLEVYTQDVCGRMDDVTALNILQYYNSYKYRHFSIMGRLRHIIGL